MRSMGGKRFSTSASQFELNNSMKKLKIMKIEPSQFYGLLV